MQLSVIRQTYDGVEAAEFAYSKRTYYLGYIKNQLKLKHINEDYVRAYAEDVLHSGIELLLTSRYECANIDEAVVEAMARAVQNAVREINNRKETADTVTFNNNKDGDKEVSRFDLHGGSMSAEQVILNKSEAACTLQDAVEMAEAIRYQYGFDITLNSLLHAGIIKGMWKESAVQGLLIAFDSVIPTHKYQVDTCIARVVSAATVAKPKELIQTMKCNISRCADMLEALGYKPSAN